MIATPPREFSLKENSPKILLSFLSPFLENPTPSLDNKSGLVEDFSDRLGDMAIADRAKLLAPLRAQRVWRFLNEHEICLRRSL